MIQFLVSLILTLSPVMQTGPQGLGPFKVGEFGGTATLQRTSAVFTVTLMVPTGGAPHVLPVERLEAWLLLPNGRTATLFGREPKPGAIPTTVTNNGVGGGSNIWFQFEAKETPVALVLSCDGDFQVLKLDRSGK
jgi:hypothetical protein